jgi:hypothetical protein
VGKTTREGKRIQNRKGEGKLKKKEGRRGTPSKGCRPSWFLEHHGLLKTDKKDLEKKMETDNAIRRHDSGGENASTGEASSPCWVGSKLRHLWGEKEKNRGQGIAKKSESVGVS